MSNVKQFPDVKHDRYLNGIDDDIVACKGGHHDWPHIKPGKLPKGVQAVPQRDGCFQIRETCRSCRLVRIKTTLPGGYYDASAKYVYTDSVGYYAPSGLGVTRYEYAAELYRRLAESILKETRSA
jgi:hypothetical protein